MGKHNSRQAVDQLVSAVASGPMPVADVIAYAAQRQMEIDSAPDMSRIIDIMELENEMGYLLEQAGHSINMDILERYSDELPEVKFRRATFKVVK